jgi:hypothetical protein
MPKARPLEEPPTLTFDTESTHGQPPTEALEDQSTLRASIPFDASISDMLDAFCAGIGTKDSNRIILDEKIDDLESVLMPSTSTVDPFTPFSLFSVLELPHPSIHEPIIPAVPTKITDLLAETLINDRMSGIPSLVLVVPAKDLRSLKIELNWRYCLFMACRTKCLSAFSDHLFTPDFPSLMNPFVELISPAYSRSSTKPERLLFYLNAK